MTDRNGRPETGTVPARPGRAGGATPWVVFVLCLLSFAVYLALHARELRLVGEWMASR